MRDLPVPAAVRLTLFAAEPDPVAEELEALTWPYEPRRKARSAGERLTGNVRWSMRG